MSAFVVTTSIHGICRSQIWDSSTPLSLGHPLRWIIEKTEKGIRARDLTGPLNQVRTNGFYEVSHAQLENGVALPLASQLQISIRKTRKINPLSLSEVDGKALRVFTCIGPWIRSAEDLINGGALSTPAFRLNKVSDGYQLQILVEGVTAEGLQEKSLQKNSTLTLSHEQLTELVLTSGTHSWRFGFIRELAAKDADFSRSINHDPEAQSFKNALKYTITAFGALMIIAMIWPKPKTDELIPAQYAKIVLTPPKKSNAGDKEAGGNPVAKAQNTAQKAAVVQAFRAKALQNSISGLLKGGMTRLLAQSDLVAGSNGRRIFETGKTGALSTSTDPNAVGSKAVMVASLGNQGIGGGVGYGKGTHAGIQGQGTSQVSLDIGGSSVEEGLTKDEVGDVIHKHLSEVRYCYESAIIRTPGIEGRLIVNFTIGGNGVVKASEIKTSTLPDPRLDDCILRRLVTWKFPNTKGAIDVAVTYPFIFKMLGMGR